MNHYRTDQPGSGVQSVYQYDRLGRTTAIEHRDRLSGVTLAAHTQSFDAASRVIGTGSLADGATGLTLDAAGRLIGAVHTAIADEAFAYDAAGNRISGQTILDPANRLVQDEDFTYTYDHAGNRTSRTDRTTGSVTTYTWDHRDRLIEVRGADAAGNLGFRVLYGYDGADRLVTRQVDASGDGVFELTERYVIEGDHILVVVDAADQVTERNLHGVRTDEVLATADPRAADPAAAVHFTLADPRGSITDTAAGPATGAVAVLNHRVFDAYGQVITQTAPAAATRFTYTGRVADPVTALTYHRARWSDPAVGRFVSEDPIRFAGGLSNLSDYVGASPYDRTDPSGRIFKWLREKVIRPIRNAISGAIDKVKEVVGKGLRQVADFVTERPLLSLGIAALTGGIGSILSGSVGAFLGKAGALGSKVLGSVLPKFTAAS